MLQGRLKRVGESIQQALSEIIRTELRDPRMPPIFTVVEVDVTQDLRSAMVYFSQLPDAPDDIKKTLEALESASGFLRSCLAKSVQLRYTPSLGFRYHPGSKRAQRLDELLKGTEKPEEKPD